MIIAGKKNLPTPFLSSAFNLHNCDSCVGPSWGLCCPITVGVHWYTERDSYKKNEEIEPSFSLSRRLKISIFKVLTDNVPCILFYNTVFNI